MATTTTTASRGPRAFASSICQACRQRLLPSASPISRRAFSSSAPSQQPFEQPHASISDILEAPQDSLLASRAMDAFNDNNSPNQPHRMHVYATKHNTHITLVQPAKPAYLTASSGISRTSGSAADQKKQIDVLLSLSAGNIGFRKAGRGSYDAAYQLGAFVCKQIQEKGMLRDIQNLQVVLRGFGAGREAVTKVLLGTEGRMIRGRIESVVDATRLKQGGPRSKKPRRLG